LNRSSGSAPEFAPMKSLLRRHIEETWPLGPRDKVLGDIVTERKFHSVLTAADEYDLRPSYVANLLRDVKLEGDLDLPEVETASLPAMTLIEVKQAPDCRSFLHDA